MVLMALLLVALAGLWLDAGPSQAQRPQTPTQTDIRWGDKGEIAVSCSHDGRYVYVAGPNGILVSNDFGRPGSWTLAVKGRD